MAHATASLASMRERSVGSPAAAAEVHDEISSDPRWQLVQRIAASESFVRAQRLSSFLLYVTHQALAENGADLNEQSIGERVFERPSGYDSREDNIVRAHASRLRQRLENYFAEHGAEEALRVSIPRGSYVPVFERARVAPDELAVAGPDDTPTTALPSVSDAGTVRPGMQRRWLWAALMVAVLVALTAILGALLHRPASHDTVAAVTPTHQLWSQMFAGDRNTLIVPADSSLVLFAELTGTRVSLADYATGRYQTTFKCAEPCNRDRARSVAERRYTSLADLEFAVALARRPEFVPSRVQVRFVRDLQLEDFKQANLILIGSLEADPWLELVENQMDFILQDDVRKGPLQILNRDPHADEKSVYIYDDSKEPRSGLAQIAFLPNLNGSGNILVLQGFTLADTQAAAEFLTNGREFDARFAPLLRGRATLPHFECLLQTTDVNGVASQPTVLAWHLREE